MPGKFPVLYPTVASVIEPHAMAAGQFIGSRPQGVTVHYAADVDLKRVIDALRKRNLGYHLIIDRDGKVHQTCYLDRKVNHAGPSEWLDQSCNRWHAAVCLLSWGQLRKDRKAWNGASIPEGEQVKRAENVSKRMAWWHAATSAQERSLVEVLRWFVAMGLDPRRICGHDEAAQPPGRKVDPGGVIRWSMDGLREAAVSDEYPW